MTKKQQEQKEVDDLIARFQESISAGELTYEEFDQILERLEELADEALPRLLDMLASQVKADRETALSLLHELGDPRAAKQLRRALFRPEYSDEDKVGIIQVLDALGEPIDEATFNRIFTDPEALMKQMMATVLDVIEAPDQVDAFLRIAEKEPPEMRAQYVRDILGPMNDRRLLPLLTSLLYSEHDAIVVAAIDAIEQLKEPATIGLLEERAQYDASALVRHAAENAALRLQVRLAGKPARPWVKPFQGPVVHCLMSTIDGAGGQVIFLTRELPDGQWRTLDVMFNDHEGIKESFSVITDDEDLNFMIGTFDTCDFADISLERCRAEVARAYQVTLDARRRLPPRFVVWQGMLEGDDTRTVEEHPLPILEPARQAELLAGCDELMSLEEFSFWFFNPDEVEAFIPRYLELLDEELTGSAYKALLGEAIEAIVDERYRRLLPERLRRQAWLLAQIYEDDEVPLWALAAAAAIEGGVIAEHPLLRSMMDISLLNATL